MRASRQSPGSARAGAHRTVVLVSGDLPSFAHRQFLLANDNVSDNYFEEALQAFGLPHSRWHDLRHTFAVLSLSAGELYVAVSKWLGHSSNVTNLQVYADYIAENEGGKQAPLARPAPKGAQPHSNILHLRRRSPTGQ